MKRAFLSVGLLLNLVAVVAVSTGKGAIASNGYQVINAPAPNTTYDGWLPAHSGLSHDSYMRLLNHIQFPQSRGAMVSTFGWPTSYQGNYDYYRIEDTGQWLAVYYAGDAAIFFTVGY